MSTFTQNVNIVQQKGNFFWNKVDVSELFSIHFSEPTLNKPIDQSRCAEWTTRGDVGDSSRQTLALLG